MLRRYKRFLADVELLSGAQLTVHCANPGSMKSCLQEGGRVWLTRSDSPTRKLTHTWQVAELDGELVFVNPALANAIVGEGIRAGHIRELAGYDLLRSEVPVSAKSRIDFVLHGAHRCYVEVKNVTLNLGNGRSAFPDAVTTRGTRHLQELEALARAGHRAVLFFCVSRSWAASVEPAREIDPVYGRALDQAVAAGVEVVAYRCAIAVQEPDQGVRLAESVRVLV